jgi:RNA polymerase sigma factor FliA
MTEELCTDTKHLHGIVQRVYAGRKEYADPAAENELIKQYLPMVHKIVKRVVTYLKPPLTYEDMVSAGTVGLVTAARDYDPAFGAEFQTYAYIRIKGAILDELRGWSFSPSNMNKRLQNARSVSLKMTQQTGSPPTDEELAEELEITTDELYEIFDTARGEHFMSLNSFSEESPAICGFFAVAQTDSPDRQAEQAELIHEMALAIQQLSEKHRHVILLYYQQHLTMKQIAEVLEITESRVSQLHASALFNLSVKLRQWQDGI